MCTSVAPTVPLASDRTVWGGRLGLAPGFGVFLGQTGDNRLHHHWAHQLTIGLDGPAQIDAGDRVLRGTGFFIRAGAPHKVLQGRQLLVFLDPGTAVARALCEQIDPTHLLAPLPGAMERMLRDVLTCDLSAQEALQRIAATVLPARREDPRLARVTEALLHAAPVVSAQPSRAQLAALLGVSPSRFSHWFCAQTGMPLRSYRKWLRLVLGLQHALQGGTLTAAAHQAEFADQAHFSRTFVQMFGVRPSELVSAIRLAG